MRPFPRCLAGHPDPRDDRSAGSGDGLRELPIGILSVNIDGKPPWSSGAGLNGYRGRIVTEMVVWVYDTGVIGTSCEFGDLDHALWMTQVASGTHSIEPGNLSEPPRVVLPQLPTKV